MSIYAPTTSGGTPPGLEDRVYLARFDGAALEEHPDWATPKDKFGKPDDGRRTRWDFTLLDEDGSVLYEDGEPITLNALLRPSMNVRSKTVPRDVKIMKALLKPAEWAAFLNGVAPTEDLEGRHVQLVVSIKENGWPNIDDVIAAPTKRSK